MATDNDNSTEAQVRARYGEPSEDNGKCECCDASGPTWRLYSVEEEVGDTLPFCAKCILKAPDVK